MNIAVIYGGKSCERDISVITALQTMGSMQAHTVFPLFIYENKFYTGSGMQNINTYKEFNTEKKKEVIIKNKKLYYLNKNKLKEAFTPNCAFICCHGGLGENGSLQGLLEMAEIPYTSPSVMSSAIGMNKITMKKILKDMGLNVVPFVEVKKDLICEDMSSAIKEVEKVLDYPVIVKPASQGSSIGIKMARSEKGLIEALITASYYDSQIIVEKAIENMIEINCAGIKEKEKIIISDCEKPVSWNAFLTFNDKYINEGGKGMKSSTRELPANIGDKKTWEIKDTTRTIYENMIDKGICRVDYMMDEDKNIFVNEINTIPGSMSFYLFESIGIEFFELINIALNQAIYEKKKQDANLTYFPSRVLGECFSLK